MDHEDALSLHGEVVHHATPDTFGVEFRSISPAEQHAVGGIIRQTLQLALYQSVSKQETKEIARTAAKAAVEASWPQTRAVLRVILIVLAVAVTLWIIVKLTGVILLLILSIFFAYLVSPAG